MPCPRKMKFTSNEAFKISDDALGGFIEKLKVGDGSEAAGAAEVLYRLTSLPTGVTIDVRDFLIRRVVD